MHLPFFKTLFHIFEHIVYDEHIDLHVYVTVNRITSERSFHFTRRFMKMALNKFESHFCNPFATDYVRKKNKGNVTL